MPATVPAAGTTGTKMRNQPAWSGSVGEGWPQIHGGPNRHPPGTTRENNKQKCSILAGRGISSRARGPARTTKLEYAKMLPYCAVEVRTSAEAVRARGLFSIMHKSAWMGSPRWATDSIRTNRQNSARSFYGKHQRRHGCIAVCGRTLCLQCGAIPGVCSVTCHRHNSRSRFFEPWRRATELCAAVHRFIDDCRLVLMPRNRVSSPKPDGSSTAPTACRPVGSWGRGEASCGGERELGVGASFTFANPKPPRPTAQLAQPKQAAQILIIRNVLEIDRYDLVRSNLIRSCDRKPFRTTLGRAG